MLLFEVARRRTPQRWSTLTLLCALTGVVSGCSSNNPDTGNTAGAPAAGTGAQSAGNAGNAGQAGNAAVDSGPPLVEGACMIDASAVPKFVQKLNCTADFEALASEPLDNSIPGARSGKVVL